MEKIKELKFDKAGLIPAVIQDIDTMQVLMMAYMNEASLLKTIETKETWFWSRSRQELWNKGATSGNIQKVISIDYDCDGDTLLIKVRQKGNACHTGEKSCFFNQLEAFTENNDSSNYNEEKHILTKVYETITERKRNPKEGSYTNYLFDKGLDKILKKVGEETAEVIIASKNTDKEELVYESSDLIYHLLVLLCHKDVKPEDVFGELEKRYAK
ncbi:bifunctional phosphoribosyl-AMP cyclohydrolase/phosphoribosyl-ATP diphosphatase HisIE [Alkaliphilus peptidifermentans]|uniref:Histidine biosynthesis bifunctional protein HisIE n=1 Tax=Alkaliphilus peptidifermentans DSM 18978 TaxID=1120976 RepID=A0A1G5ACX7_9FIRM|nr:bifunctional phosphoribosyl-AMP cyclohydrolase/phosphoribosyl-ATP diphosphatase HisIE [Alkaliphilus peptidifermentans]SCX75713.1 phosphoribosyl-ATP pyrophosphatase /phosphoribosyl-AMP cyclohydrolase [Alkaliphilus peptidifermentans DSM 18978]